MKCTQSENRCHLLHFKYKSTVTETTSSSNVFFTANKQHLRSGQVIWEVQLVSTEHLCMRQASVTTHSVTQPRDEAITLAASDTAVYKVIFCNNLFKLQSPLQTLPLLVDLLQRLNMSILAAYPANPCLRPKTQQFWETTCLHFSDLS